MEQRADSIISGSFCSECAKIKNRADISNINDMAKNRGGKCLSKYYESKSTKLKWECEIKHSWYALYSLVKQGSWCPECSLNKTRNGIIQAKNIAIERGGECVDTKYINAHTRMQWKCKLGHMWVASFHKIKNSNRWCPKCKSYKTQKLIHDIVIRVLELSENEIHMNYKEFKWLKTSTYGKQEIDIYVPKYKLAIEYDGEQHFSPVKFGQMSDETAIKRLDRQKELDHIKNIKIANSPKDIRFFIRISCKDKLKLNKEYIKNKFKECGLIKL